MGRFLVLWQQNPNAPWPTDAAERLKMNEMMMTAIDGLIKKGEIEEFGFFLDGTSGYGISKGEVTDAYRRVSMFQPYITAEVHEIIPFEKGWQISREVMKAKVEAAKK
jgi:hypothetical protein